MSILDLTIAKAQGRITWASEDALLQSYLDAAEAHCARFLNRNVYVDQAALDAAIAAAPAALATAKAAYEAAYAAWAALPDSNPSTFDVLNGSQNQRIPGEPLTSDSDVAQIAYDKLIYDWNTAKAAARLTYFGMVANDAFKQAAVLLFAGWAVNREFVITELGNAIELPFGVTALLVPYRVQQGV